MDDAEVQKLSRRIHSRLRTMGLSSADCEDIEQQVFEDFLRSRDAVKNPATWVGVVAYRKGIAARYRNRFTALGAEPAVCPRLDLQLDVRRALAQSSKEARHLLTLRFLDGNTVNEIVESGYGSESTVKRHVARAAKVVRERLCEQVS